MFLRGATPHRLIRHIQESHHEEDWPRYVQAYFWEAFSVVCLDFEGFSRDKDLNEINPESLNGELLHNLVRRSGHWRADHNSTLESVWCDGLNYDDELDVMDQLDPKLHPSLAQYWSTLPVQVQTVICQTMINSQINRERAELLSRLVQVIEHQLEEGTKPTPQT